MRKLTLHFLVGLMRELEPPCAPLGHDVSLPLLLSIGLLQLLILLAERADVGPQPALGDLEAVLSLGSGIDLGFQLPPQLLQLGPQAGCFPPNLLDFSGIGGAGSLLILQGLEQLIPLRWKGNIGQVRI